MSKLIAQMIARNEADRFLPDVLSHLNNIVDLVVFTDDCSDDNTLEVARKFDCKTFSSIWDSPHFGINEGELRAQAWGNLEQFVEVGDWILAIDADEKLYGQERLPELMTGIADVLGITFYHMWDHKHYRADKAWRPTISSRLFRYYPNGCFNLRKLACGSEPTYVLDLIRSGRCNWNTGLRMKHLGYVFDEDKQAKYDRYMKLDGGDFHSRTHIESIIDPDPLLVYWE